MYRFWLAQKRADCCDSSCSCECRHAGVNTAKLVRLFPTVHAGEANDQATNEKAVTANSSQVNNVKPTKQPAVDKNAKEAFIEQQRKAALYEKYKDKFNFEPEGETAWDRVSTLWQSIPGATSPEGQLVSFGMCTRTVHYVPVLGLGNGRLWRIHRLHIWRND